ncbi:MAG: menaquinone biosynthesis protein [Phycisphaeraceae bacterium]|nr:menaquinone biosynthesis protein [Phycisphaeraceae bacterium]
MLRRSPSDACLAPLPRIAAVSFLNTKPLVHGFDDLVREAGKTRAPKLQLHVPSRLLASLESGKADLALCPVIDYFRSERPLTLVPCGGIGCQGPTLTVMLYSRKPWRDVTDLHADTDSHTSVALAQIILHGLFRCRPKLHRLTRSQVHFDHAGPPTVLLIGDKVVTHAPPRRLYPHQLDLGQAWLELTGLPFLFAVWMARPEVDLGDWPLRLDGLKQRNLRRVPEIAAEYAPKLGWPVDLAEQYLGHSMRYDVGPAQKQAVEAFAQRCLALGLIDQPRPLSWMAYVPPSIPSLS